MRQKKRSHGRSKAPILICALAVVAVAGYFGLCAAAGDGTIIFPNVTAAGVDLGGLTCEEAEAKLNEAVLAAPPEENRGVVFDLEGTDGQPVTVKVPLSAVNQDNVATAARAWDVGNKQAFAARGGTYLKCLVSGAEILPVYGESERLDQILDDMDAQVGRVAEESAWQLTDTQLVVTKGQPGYLIDREGLKEQAFEYLGRGEVVDLEGTAPQFTVNLNEILPKDLDLQSVLDQVETQVQDAVFDKANKTFQVDSVGISFDAQSAQDTFQAMEWGTTKEIPLILTQPQTTVSDLAPLLYQDVLGTCSTDIAGTANRVQNINLAAQYFNGTILMPGEEFSYNGTVGQRTAQRGFLSAPAYVSGQSVQETGGGICQGSSTIYLAALRSNLEIVERYNHSYITRYVPEGMDATVYYGAKDFRFKNNTPFPVKVVGAVSGRTLTVNIMGTKTDNVTVEMTNQTVGTSGYNTVYKVDASLPAGSTQVSVTPYTGYTVKVYRNVYENGVLKDTKLESTNVYKSRDKVILVSPADAGNYHISG